MPGSLDDFLQMRPPTVERPLQGQTVLIVEDSRFASEALRMLCLRSGARVRRADSLSAAERHLRTYRPSVVIVDLGLPDGSGTDLIRRLALAPHCPVVIASSGQDGLEDAARAAGALGFLPKPIESLAGFQQAVLAVLPPEQRPDGPRPVHRDDRISPDRIALRDDLALVAGLLDRGPGEDDLDYLAGFVAGLGRIGEDRALEAAARTLSDACRSGAPTALARDALAEAISARLSTRASV